jgi:hypothetical protein
MPMGANELQAYQEKIASAVLTAIVESSLTVASDGTRTAVLMSDQIVNALVDV